MCNAVTNEERDTLFITGNKEMIDKVQKYIDSLNEEDTEETKEEIQEVKEDKEDKEVKEEVAAEPDSEDGFTFHDMVVIFDEVLEEELENGLDEDEVLEITMQYKDGSDPTINIERTKYCDGDCENCDGYSDGYSDEDEDEDEDDEDCDECCNECDNFWESNKIESIPTNINNHVGTIGGWVIEEDPSLAKHYEKIGRLAVELVELLF